MADEVPERTGAGPRGLTGELGAIVDDLERTKAAGYARVLFDIAERLIILTAVSFGEQKAPAGARAGFFVLKMLLTSAFVFWIVQPLAKRVMAAGRRINARAEENRVVRRILTAAYILIVIGLAYLVSHVLNYFLSYLSPHEITEG